MEHITFTIKDIQKTDAGTYSCQLSFSDDVCIPAEIHSTPRVLPAVPARIRLRLAIYRLNIAYQEIMMRHSEKRQLRRLHEICCTRFMALNKNDIKIINKFVNVKFEDNLTPIHLVCNNHRNVELASHLIDAGCNLYSEDTSGGIPLNYAIAKNCFKLVKFLVDKMPDLAIRTPILQRSILVACYNSDPIIINLLMEKATQENLNFLNKHGNPDVLKILLYIKVNMMLKNCHGYRAIEMASMKGNLKIVKALIANLGQISSVRNLVKICIEQAIYKERYNIIDYLVSSYKSEINAWECFSFVIMNDQLSVFKYLVEKEVITKSDIQSEICNSTILNEMVKGESSEIFKFILAEYDINVTRRDKYGYTLFHYIQSEKVASTLMNKYENDCNTYSTSNIDKKCVFESRPSNTVLLSIKECNSPKLDFNQIHNIDVLKKLMAIFSNINNNTDDAPRCCLHLKIYNKKDAKCLNYIEKLLKKLDKQHQNTKLEMNCKIRFFGKQAGIKRIKYEELQVIAFDLRKEGEVLTYLKGDCSIIQFLIEQVSMKLQIGFDYLPGVYSLVDPNRISVFKILFEENFINIRDLEYISRTSFLNRAINKDNAELVKLLLDKGTDLSSSYNFSDPIESENIAKLILEKYKLLGVTDINPYLWRSIYLGGYLEPVCELLSLQQTSVTNKDNIGRTPLHLTCVSRSPQSRAEVARKLLTNGAKVNEMDDSGETPLDYALVRKKLNDNLIKVLRNYGGLESSELREHIQIQFDIENYIDTDDGNGNDLCCEYKGRHLYDVLNRFK